MGNNKVKVSAQTIVQFIKFGMVGVVNNIIYLAVYYIAIYFRSDLYLLGNILGFLVSTLNAYLMNSKLVFHTKEQENGKTQLIKTYITYIAALCMSTAILYGLVNGLGMSEKTAPIFSLIITIPFNFLMNKFWIYGKK